MEFPNSLPKIKELCFPELEINNSPSLLAPLPLGCINVATCALSGDGGFEERGHK